ncbi:NERD domain-containing protein [Algoriphagus sp. D3-2-R+10]|uniref:NERD domain-containing protein n=1 Tax=Algoriphagus aurantiacus TaxID=3103948 RepID=UPI002B387ED6|nr:NERD domain-containing protein [Algoriphagus sp. D3-2-R+10]MEB2777459.1 NERD domain-containing protein [Algoriphagus sp. D3-2-R+10]
METQILVAVISLLFLWFTWYLKKEVVPKVIGRFGELKISLRLKRLSKKEYIVLNDVLLQIGESSTQIDHIVISKSGLHVIETKNLKGWIHGHENSEYWKQTLYRRKYTLKNPVKQNEVHVQVLKKILSDYPHIKFSSIVVFSGSAVLKNMTTWSPVIYASQLIRTIREDDEDAILSFDQMAHIADRLNSLRLRGKEEIRKHVQRIQKKERENLTSDTCPSCGNYLIKRKGRYGEFYGCSSYPKCKYSQTIADTSSNRR